MKNYKNFFVIASIFEFFLGFLGWGIAAFYFGSPHPFLFQYQPHILFHSFLYLIPLVFFLLFFNSKRAKKIKSVREFHDSIKKNILPAIQNLSMSELFFLSLAAGVGEEFLFRGAFQPMMGLLFSSIFFALLHSVSHIYALLAFGMSLYLGWIYQNTGNLLAPVIVHCFYDFIAFLLLRKK